MQAHKVKVTIPKNNLLTLKLPDNFPSGLAEVIVLADSSTVQRTVKLGGVLTPDPPLSLSDNVDPIADTLQEFRFDRNQRFDKNEKDKAT